MNKKISKNLLIGLEGNIGAGKSTLLRNILNKDVKIYEEEHGRQVYLNDFYDNMTQNSFSLQMKIFLDQCNRILTHKINIFERSCISLHEIFGELLYKENIYPEHHYLLEEQIINKFSLIPDYIIYLRTPAEECLRRLEIRKKTEDNKITIDYLKKLEIQHDEKLLKKNNLFVIDGNLTDKEINDKVMYILSQLI